MPDAMQAAVIMPTAVLDDFSRTNSDRETPFGRRSETGTLLLMCRTPPKAGTTAGITQELDNWVA
jgi:hypothetical protein